jgi:hypothetical protein
VAYTASIKPRIVQAIPSAGPFTTPMIGLGKSIREFTKILKKNVYIELFIKQIGQKNLLTSSYVFLVQQLRKQSQ